MSPRTPEEKNAGLRSALLTPELFNKVYTQFNAHKLPPKELLANTLVRDFNVAPSDKMVCADMIVKNAIELAIITDIKGSQYLQLDKLGKGVVELSQEQQEAVDEATHATEEEAEAAEKEPTLPPHAPKVVKPTVFISHSKNMKIVDQLKQILSFGGFNYQIAVEKETTAIPIPEKIFELMRKCNCAVINISADEQEKKSEGVYGINPNVLIEIGSAFLSYNKRVILLVDKRTKLPSNLQGLYICSYEGDELTWETGMKLQKALAEFREGLTAAPEAQV